MITATDLQNLTTLDAAMNDLFSMQRHVDNADRKFCGSLLAQYFQQGKIDFSEKQLAIFIKIAKKANANRRAATPK
jgi:hypothetical protein